MDNMFVITGAVNNGIASIMDHSIQIDDADEYFKKYQLLGKGLGAIL